MYEQEGESETFVDCLFVCLPVLYIQFPQDCFFFSLFLTNVSVFVFSSEVP